MCRAGVLPGLTRRGPASPCPTPSESTAENPQPHLEYVFYGGGSVDPVPMLGNVNPAGAAPRDWAINLNKELADSGVHAAHVAINVWIGDGACPCGPTSREPRCRLRPRP
ncbi:hypothetical protein [Streptomyces sp. NPDC127098]|uniref:hypothetical protein n=1 Tax=Streptomyces sp. NPDC127098 TaxID=3347137 RepID=UPI0036545C67